MGILDFLKNKKNKIVKKEESEEDKVRKELLSKTYNRAFLFYGDVDRTIEIDGQSITYTHSECFLADNKYPSSIKRFIRLTGENLDGTPVFVEEYDNWKIGDSSGVILYIQEGGVKYKISSSSCLDACWLNNHNMTGYEVAEATDRYNNIKIDSKLKNIAEQKSIDSLFEK